MGILNIQWTLSISATLYLEYLSISNKIFGPLKFPPRTLHSLSLFRISLSRTFPYNEQIFRSLEPFSLSLSLYPFLTLAPKIVEAFLKNRPQKLFSNCLVDGLLTSIV